MQLSRSVCLSALLLLGSLPGVAQVPAVPIRDVNNPAFSAVNIQYTCGNSTGANLPPCTPNYNIPEGARLVIQNISGTATPLNGAATFPTTQANLTISSQLENSMPITNIVGPNYALTNSKIWFFNTPVIIYTDVIPTVFNNNGNVLIQGYLVRK